VFDVNFGYAHEPKVLMPENIFATFVKRFNSELQQNLIQRSYYFPDVQEKYIFGGGEIHFE
jgi:hypothetical protein